MFAAEVWNEIASNLGLSVRELEIVRGTFDDQTESAIATKLRIALGTVHTHIERLHHKLAVTDRAQLILRIVQEYLALAASPGHRLSSFCANRAPRGHPSALHCNRRSRKS